MISLTDLIAPPLIAFVIAATLGILLARIRVDLRAPGWIALDVALLLPALIPVPVLANAFLAACPAGTDKTIAWILAAALTTAPLAYLPARIALGRTTARYRDTNRLLGLGPVASFFRIDLPLTWKQMGLGKLLALTRVTGEWLLVIGALDRLTILTVGIVFLALAAAFGVAFSLPRTAPRADAR